MYYFEDRPSRKEKYIFVVIILVILTLLGATSHLFYLNKELRKENKSLTFDLQHTQRELHELADIRETYLPIRVTVTAYAPLDTNAIEGMCYSGDPRVTASGAPSTPGRSVAMGRDFAFGTEVFIPGFGHRVVEDRGGAIKNNNIDIMVETQKEAFEFGRREMVIFVKE